jgi:DNA-binding response OmpR family regulator
MEQSLRVLIYEPNKKEGMLLVKSLEKQKIAATLLQDSQELYNTFIEGRYHLGVIRLDNKPDALFSIAKKIKKEKDGSAIMYIGEPDNKNLLIKAFGSVADDFVRTPYEPKEVALRVAAILRRTVQPVIPYEPVIIYQIGQFRFHPIKRTLTLYKEQWKLTTKDSDLLHYFCQHAGKVVKREDALRAVWHDDGFFPARSMDVYITRLRKRLRQDTSVSIVNEHSVGYKLLVSK